MGGGKIMENSIPFKMNMEEWHKFKDTKFQKTYRLRVYMRFANRFGYDKMIKHVKLINKILEI